MKWAERVEQAMPACSALLGVCLAILVVDAWMDEVFGPGWGPLNDAGRTTLFVVAFVLGVVLFVMAGRKRARQWRVDD